MSSDAISPKKVNNKTDIHQWKQNAGAHFDKIAQIVFGQMALEANDEVLKLRRWECGTSRT